MTVINTLIQPAHGARVASGKFSFSESSEDPTTLVKTIGWVPAYVQFVNLTDRISYEWYTGMAATHTLKTAANGDRTDDTGDAAIAVDADAGTITFSAAAVIEDKECYWVARA